MSGPVEFHWVLSYATPSGDLGYRDGTITVLPGGTRREVFRKVIESVSRQAGPLVVTRFSLEPNVLGGAS